MIKSTWLRGLLVLSLLVGAGLSLAACTMSEEDIRNWEYAESPLSEEDKILMAAEEAGFSVVNDYPTPHHPSSEHVDLYGDWAEWGYLDAHREDGTWKFGCATRPNGKGDFYEINGNDTNDEFVTQYWVSKRKCPPQPWSIEQVKEMIAGLSSERL